jgi:tRNA pseudouridine55 synthase
MQTRVKKVWQQIDGVLLLDKASGLSSNDALQKARRLFSAAKGGHTGTLDPLATGLLPLCFGEATKFSADLLDADKTYEAEVRLGEVTDTGDAEGQVTASFAVDVDLVAISAVLPRFTGPIRQIPPMYSALKRDGRPLYELARQGIEVERAARDITIHALECLEFTGQRLVLRVSCSKGTYIRVLAADIGQALGCGAHLTALRRTRVGPLDLAGSVTLAQLETMSEAERLA